MEHVLVVDPDGTPVGSATRARMRAEGLWHACAVIVVRSRDGERLFVHRRTDTKDVYPGLYDPTCGGVVAADETPDECAVRELAEELGVTEPPKFLFKTPFVDGTIRYIAHVYEVRCDGPFTLQPEEVASGEWVDVAEVRAKAECPEWPVVPDGRALIREWFSWA
ncbi:NUDIX domain-containing protein [Actinosynnema sp. NPDC047251]|uniref:NUDIX family hydrolase n=1 Tax=Saccharothrix espanaensis (strain ATCC 51144 / DSM 44229 / JCM 9112 / NBRC 15066 / NRRL 15764) TaxID=1179773 RepID=K0K0S7_SACES|nr:NUDIX domain-containing protein [Saccharothrix espanaensis]CCH30484.1 NUDIX family hydrolase [Saccharothrix espanaensis DSM 44229]